MLALGALAWFVLYGQAPHPVGFTRDLEEELDSSIPWVDQAEARSGAGASTDADENHVGQSVSDAAASRNSGGDDGGRTAAIGRVVEPPPSPSPRSPPRPRLPSPPPSPPPLLPSPPPPPVPQTFTHLEQEERAGSMSEEGVKSVERDAATAATAVATAEDRERDEPGTGAVGGAVRAAVGGEGGEAHDLERKAAWTVEAMTEEEAHEDMVFRPPPPPSLPPPSPPLSPLPQSTSPPPSVGEHKHEDEVDRDPTGSRVFVSALVATVSTPPHARNANAVVNADVSTKKAANGATTFELAKGGWSKMPRLKDGSDWRQALDAEEEEEDDGGIIPEKDHAAEAVTTATATAAAAVAAVAMAGGDAPIQRGGGGTTHPQRTTGVPSVMSIARAMGKCMAHRDLKPGLCTTWAHQGQCSHAAAAEMMRRDCRNSCCRLVAATRFRQKQVAVAAAREVREAAAARGRRMMGDTHGLVATQRG